MWIRSMPRTAAASATHARNSPIHAGARRLQKHHQGSSSIGGPKPNDPRSSDVAVADGLGGRRATIAALAASLFVWSRIDAPCEAAATYDRRTLEKLEKMYAEAFAFSGDPDGTKAEDAWTKIIEFAPDTSSAWSNRGTFRLQRGRWVDAVADLEHAVELEGGMGSADGYLVNNLSNALGAVGEWDRALEGYKQTAESASSRGDVDLAEIADANYALAEFQVGNDREALQKARNLLRRDANFLDMRCLETAVLWAMGDEAGAETAWNELQAADEGKLYEREIAVYRVFRRWPPRCTAALSAFLAIQRKGTAEDYDGKTKTYNFG